MSFIVASPLSRLEEMGAHYQPSHMITLINAGVEVKRPISVSKQNHLYLNFNDINVPVSGLISPKMAHIQQLLDHGKNWHEQTLNKNDKSNATAKVGDLSKTDLSKAYASLQATTPHSSLSDATLSDARSNTPPLLIPPLLIHCAMGISRSTAAAYSIAAYLNPNRDEYELALALRQASPSATPNMGIIALADEFLGRQGRMMEAIQEIGRGRDAFEGTPFKLEL